MVSTLTLEGSCPGKKGRSGDAAQSSGHKVGWGLFSSQSHEGCGPSLLLQPVAHQTFLHPPVVRDISKDEDKQDRESLP